MEFMGDPVSGGSDAFQVERLRVSPERILLRHFRVLEAIGLPTCKPSKAGPLGSTLPVFTP